MQDLTIESKGADGKSKPLKIDDDGNLIIQYTKDEKEGSEQVDEVNTKYRYYEDLNGNQYRWTTHKQLDNKFHARILKLKKNKTWNRYQLHTVKERAFAKKKTAIAWLLRACIKAKKRQQEVLDGRNKRKQARLDLKPKGKEKSKIEAKEKLLHFRKLSWNVDKQRKDLEKKHKKQLRSLGTRQINYNKKVKYYKKRVEDL